MEGRVGERARPAAPELLAPAGGAGALRAAIRNGADAVYLGTGSLNARRGAENFSLPALAEACDFAHLRGARVYLTANVVVLASEMPAALELIARSWEAGVDAVIVQDLGLLLALHRSLPDVRVHASTQLDAHNAASVAALAGLGVQRVTLARELSVVRDRHARRGLAGADRVLRARFAVLLPFGPMPHVVDGRRPLREPRTVRAAVQAAVRARRRVGIGGRDEPGGTCSVPGTLPGSSCCRSWWRAASPLSRSRAA